MLVESGVNFKLRIFLLNSCYCSSAARLLLQVAHRWFLMYSECSLRGSEKPRTGSSHPRHPLCSGLRARPQHRTAGKVFKHSKAKNSNKSMKFFFSLILKYWCVYLFTVLAMPHGMQDLISLTGDSTVPPAVEAQSPNHWTTRECPRSSVFSQIPFPDSTEDDKVCLPLTHRDASTTHFLIHTCTRTHVNGLCEHLFKPTSLRNTASVC